MKGSLQFAGAVALCTLGALSPASGETSMPVVQPASVPGRISITGAGHSFLPRFSPDGSAVAFLSQANNLVTNDDRRPFLDLFWRGLQSRTTVLVSLNTAGTGGADHDIRAYALSSNGLVIAFQSAAANLISLDTNQASDIFVRDLQGGPTTLVSINAARTGPGNGPSFNPQISADGRFVTFESTATDLVTNDFNGAPDVFIHDRLSGITTLVSVDATGTASPRGASTTAATTPDAHFVAFVSTATNLVAGANEPEGQLYVRDLVQGSSSWARISNLRLPRNPGWIPAGVTEPALSDDGRFLAFATTNGAVMRFDLTRPTNTVLRNFPPTSFPPAVNAYYFQDNPRLLRFEEGVQPGSLSLTPDGRYLALATGTNEGSRNTIRHIDFDELAERAEFITEDGVAGYWFTNAAPTVQIITSNAPATFPGSPALSADGRRIAFLQGTSADSGGYTGPPGVWVRDMSAPQAWWISSNRFGLAATASEEIIVALSADGTQVAWDSLDDELIPADGNGASDVFVRTLPDGELRAVSERDPGLPAVTAHGLANIAGGALSPDGRWLAMLTEDSTLGAHDTNGFVDAYLRDMMSGSNLLVSSVSRGLDPSLRVGTNEVFFTSVSADGRYAAFTEAGVFPDISGLRYYAFKWCDLSQGICKTIQGSFKNAMRAPALGADGHLVALGVLSFHPDEEDVFLLWGDDSPRQSPLDVGVGRRNVVSYGNGPSILPVLSPDNSWIAFQSRAGNFTPDPYPPPTNYQVLARRLELDPTHYPTQPFTTPVRLISYTTAASAVPDGHSTELPMSVDTSNAVFSADAQFLFFTAAPRSVYRHELLKEWIETLTTNSSPSGVLILTNLARVTNLLVCADCAAPSVSGDGRFVAFETAAPGSATTQIYLKDLDTGEAELVSVNPSEMPGNGQSFGPLLSFDARYVVFTSQASDLVANDANHSTDIFVRDRIRGVTLALSSNLAGTGTGNHGSSAPQLAADGRTVAFQSFATDLVSGDYNETRDVFVARLSGVDDDADGMDDDWEMTYFGTLSRDGSGDFDGDGASDLAEFRSGTNPANDGSILRVLAVRTANDTPVSGQRTTTIFWSSAPGKSYRVQTKTAFDAGWVNLFGDVVAAGTLATKMHSVTNGPARFYRVVGQ